MKTRKKIRIGIIGTGFGYKVVFKSLKKNKDLKVIGFTNKNGGRRLIKSYIYFENWKRLISSNKIDAVFITSPPNTHKEIVDFALRKNKHIFCEKPCTTSLRNINYIVKKFEKKKNLSFMVNYEFNEIKAFKFFKRNILTKKLNKENISLIWNIQLKKKKKSWKENSKLGGGLLFNFVCHALSYIENLFGKIVHIKSNIIIKKSFQSLNANFYIDNGQKLKMKMRVDYGYAKSKPIHNLNLLTGKTKYKLGSKTESLYDQFSIEKLTRGQQKKILFKPRANRIDFRIEPTYKNSIKFSNWIKTKKKHKPSIYEAQRVHYLINQILKSSRYKKILYV